jgi:Xaa-Pro aminopeptidase
MGIAGVAKVKGRIEQFRRWMESQGVDVSVVLKPHDVLYLSGSAPVCSGLLIFRHSPPIQVCIWLDGSEVKRNSSFAKVAGYRFPESSMAEKMANLILKNLNSPHTIGIEKDYMTARFLETLQGSFPRATFVSITRALDEMRAIKTPQEILCLKKATAMAEAGMKAALAAVKPGVTEIDIAAEAEYAMRRAGSEGLAFGTLVASGLRTLLAHPYASRRKIGRKDVVVIDLGAKYRGYSSDLCRTTFTGKPSVEQKNFLKVVLKAQEAAFKAAKPGALSGQVYAAAESVLAEGGYDRYLPGDIGYGSGLRQSEFFPVILKNGQDILQAGMVVALFQTTAYLRRIGGIRVEDQIVIRPKGFEKLSQFPQPLFDGKEK